MFKFFLFIKKIHFVLIFIVLEGFALHYYANSTSYTKAKLITASNYVVGGIYSQLSGLNSYFHLKKENVSLTEKIAELENELERYRHPVYTAGADSSALQIMIGDTVSAPENRPQYAYSQARVINNSIIRQENYITLDKGVDAGLQPDMALISDGGIAGYVIGCSEHFSVCMSILNRDFKTSGKIKGTDYFGSVTWDGTSYEYLKLSEVAKYATLQKGDTIVTTSHSSRFPPEIMIGTVESFELNNATYYDVRVKIHTDMAALNNVLVVKYLDAEERETLENSMTIDTESDYN